MQYRVVINPKAGGGRAGRQVSEISAAMRHKGLVHDVVHTRGPGDAARCVREARDDGIACVVIVGGDGTFNEACQAYVTEDGTPCAGPELALIPSGTGGDFRKTFDLPNDVEAAVNRLAKTSPRPLDLGVLRVTDAKGAPVSKAFLNITSFGIGGLTDRIVNESPKWMGGRAAFFLGTLRAMFVYRDVPTAILVDGEPWLEAPIFNVAIANGRFFGGGMMIAPNADPSDGLFDVVALANMNRPQVLALSSRIYKGAHLDARGVSATRGSKVEARPLRSRDEVLIDMDGETPGRLPLTATVAAGAIQLRA
ncbi:MAG: diacylglycerol kinase family lipid kinase [Polyangiaceae bacterium]